MDPGRATVAATVAVIAGLALATGPTLGVLSIPEAGPDDFGGGTATVDVWTVPDRATLNPAEYADVYYLDVPDATFVASNLSGTPILTVSVYVRELGISPSNVYTPDRGPARYGVERVPIDAERVDRETYQGRLVVVLRDSTGERVLYDAPILVEVVR